MAAITTSYQGLESPRQAVADVKAGGHPLDAAGAFGKSIFAWCNPLVSLGNSRQLAPTDIWGLQDCNKVGPLLQHYLGVYEANNKGLLKAFFSIYKWKLVLIAIMQAALTGCNLFGPAYVLPQVIASVVAKDWARGTLLAVALYAVQMFGSFLSVHMTFMNQVIGIQFTACLRSMLFEKSLKLSAKSRKLKTAGDIANLFSVDVVNVMALPLNLNMAWIVPIEVGVTLYLIERQVGWAIWVGFLALFVLLILTGAVGAFAGKAQRLILTCKDDRMKVVNEIFAAIQIVKFNAWEEKLVAKVRALREKELGALWFFIKTILILITSMNTTPVLITVVVFATYALWMGQLLTVSIVFTTLALFDNLRVAFIAMPMVFVSTIQALVSVKRIDEVLGMDEVHVENVVGPSTTAVDKDLVQACAAANSAIHIANGSFGWDKENPLFANLNWTVKQGEFVVVHGAVGSGKSSLCSILVGEMDKYDGTVFVSGRVAYFTQQSWIQNASIRDNILFGRPYDRVRYQTVLNACGLTKDIASFAAKDRTEIGLKGVNLSGGQKARVSLARACYADADVYILDAPLSAVDAIVANEIFTKCFQTLLKHKTIVLVTHNTDIIESTAIDRSFLLDNGKLTETTPSGHVKRQTGDAEVVPLTGRPQLWDDLEVVADASQARPHDLLLTPTAQSPYVFQHGEPLAIFTPRAGNESAHGQESLTVEEERAEGRVSKEVVLSYVQAIGGWTSVAIMLLATIATEATRLNADLWLTGWTEESNAVGAASKSVQQVKDDSNYNMMVYAILVLATCFVTIFQFGIVLGYGLRGSRVLFERMLAGLIAAPMRFFDSNPIGRILNRCGDDVFQCDIMLPMSFAPILAQTATALAKLGLSVAGIKWMALLLPPLGFIYVKLGAYYLMPLREVNRIKKVTLSPLLSLVSEGVDGAVVIRAFGDKYRRRFYRLHDVAIENYSAATFTSDALNQWFALRVAFVSNSIVFCLVLGLVVMASSVSPGLVGLVFAYGLTIPTNLAQLVNMWANLETALISPERLNEYAMLPIEGARETPVDQTEWPVHGRLTYDNVSFRYKADDPLVLENVTFDVAGGEKIGIVGRTGAGKSSLMMTLFRINDVASGSISIDGVDIATVGLKRLRSSLAIIPQNPVLFKGTLRNYMDPFDEFSDDQLWDALRKVNLTDRIRVSDDKLEQHVEENGENFSVGERQMLCMARALLRNAKIVVLDEATAAIDHATDQLLQKVIREEFASSTVLTIAHRLDTVLDYHRIFVFDAGRLVQCDTPAALVKQERGIFYDMITEGGYTDRVQV
ncbi:hypothetical protein H310_10158 [Aphanomyces invadans]|uniref:Multidrug resistance-associated protein 1 n=1 Tax=Aphanomyces invadans TaxID=157072 RepID=A0A024TU85_9STRA|nr:hypothetical protein H310_10158 [Aphanomyces invadans]ETV96882.1 hypothetical protein H310_10158 [Aphanomyces invadans]|eukprot:XP_008874659.1 hypothetical protein H310_10158 [Aphanomyces invadans]